MVLLSGATPPWTDPSDDDLSGQTGTVFSAAFWANQRDAINNLLHSTVNPTLTPKGIIDVVKTAYGNLASLDARIGGVIDANGAFISPANLPTALQLQDALGSVNHLANDTFLIWPAGDTSAPAHWTTTGAPTLARTGTGLADTQRKVDDFALKATTAGVAATLRQYLLGATSFSRAAAAVKGYKFGFGAWVFASAGGYARVLMNDGVTTTASPFHTGDATWQWLSGVHTVSATGTILYFALDLGTTGTAYISAPVAVFSDVAPARYIPARVIYGSLSFPRGGTLAVVTGYATFMPRRPFIVRDVQLRANTAPTGAALIVQLSKFDGTAWQDLFTAGGRPQVAAGANLGGAQPDAAYANRCLTSGFGVNATNTIIRTSIDQVGSTVAGSDLMVVVGALQYTRPFEMFHGFNEIGETSA